MYDKSLFSATNSLYTFQLRVANLIRFPIWRAAWQWMDVLKRHHLVFQNHHKLGQPSQMCLDPSAHKRRSQKINNNYYCSLFSASSGWAAVPLTGKKTFNDPHEILPLIKTFSGWIILAGRSSSSLFHSHWTSLWSPKTGIRVRRMCYKLSSLGTFSISSCWMPKYGGGEKEINQAYVRRHFCICQSECTSPFKYRPELRGSQSTGSE